MALTLYGIGMAATSLLMNEPIQQMMTQSGYLADGSNFGGFVKMASDSQTLKSLGNGGDGNIFLQVGTGLRDVGTPQTVEFQLRQNAHPTAFAQMHYHIGPVHQWKHGIDGSTKFAIWNNLHATIWEAFQPGMAPAVVNGPRTGNWQDFKGNIHQDGQIVQDVLWDPTWITNALSTTTPASSTNAWITKATFDITDTTTRQFRAFYGWTQLRGAAIQPNTTVQGGLFYGETAENFTGQIGTAIGAVGIGSRLFQSTGIIDRQIGFSGIAFSAGGPTTGMYGVTAQVTGVGTSTWTSARAFMVDLGNVSATTTISGDVTGVYITDPNTWGGIGAASRYAVYSTGGAWRILSAGTVAAPSTGTAFLINVWGTSSDTTATSFGQNMVTINHTHTNNSTTAKQPRGMYVITYYNGSGLAPSTSVQGALFEGATDPTFTGSVGSVYGLVMQGVRNGNAGTISTALAGASITASTFSNATGTVAMMLGAQINLLAIGATNIIVGDVRGINIPVSNLGTASIGGNLIGVYIGDVSLSGGVVTGKRYGIYAVGGGHYLNATQGYDIELIGRSGFSVIDSPVPLVWRSLQNRWQIETDGLGINATFGLITYSNGAALYSDVQGQVARGTSALPTGVLANDRLVAITGRGFYGGATNAFSGSGGGKVSVFAAEAYLPGAGGSYVTVETTLIGTTTRREMARFLDTGDLELKVIGTGLIVAAPNGTRYRLTATNAGAVSLVAA